MEIDAFIDAVRIRRPIWDTSSKHHNDREHIMILWHEISNELNIECSIAKKKWRALRENYRKEHVKKRSQAAGDNWKSTWAYFDDLSFLQDQFVPRTTTSTRSMRQPGSSEIFMQVTTDPPENEYITIDNLQDTTENDNELETVDEIDMECSVPSRPISTPPKTFTKISAGGENRNKNQPTLNKRMSQIPQRPKELKTQLLQKMVMLEEEKFGEYLKRQPSLPAVTQSPEVHDADYHFLMSLLPSLRAVPANRKLLLRQRIEDLFLQEESEYNTMAGFNN